MAKITNFNVLEAKLDLDNWENKRGPRPWEEGSIEKRPIRVGILLISIIHPLILFILELQISHCIYIFLT